MSTLCGQNVESSMITATDQYRRQLPRASPQVTCKSKGQHHFSLLLFTGCSLFVFLALELVRNVMVHAQKPDFVFRLNGRVHLNRRGSQFSRLLAAKVCASALVMLDTPRSEIVWEYWLPTPFASFPFTSPPVRHRVPPHSERNIQPSVVVF